MQHAHGRLGFFVEEFQPERPAPQHPRAVHFGVNGVGKPDAPRMRGHAPRHGGIIHSRRSHLPDAFAVERQIRPQILGERAQIKAYLQVVHAIGEEIVAQQRQARRFLDVGGNVPRFGRQVAHVQLRQRRQRLGGIGRGQQFIQLVLPRGNLFQPLLRERRLEGPHLFRKRGLFDSLNLPVR